MKTRAAEAAPRFQLRSYFTVMLMVEENDVLPIQALTVMRCEPALMAREVSMLAEVPENLLVPSM